MSSTTYLKSFFHQLTEVVGELADMFPDDPDFKVFQTYISLLQRTNPTMVIDTFHEHVGLKFENEINAKNEDFVLNYQSTEYGSDGMDIVAKIKSYWSVLSPESRAAIWQYIYILKELAKKYKA
jgi:hypothetical protein